MNILFISALLPYPLYSGGQVRIFNLLQRLSQQHKITLLAYIRNESEKDLLGNLSFCHRVETVFRGRAWQPQYVFNSLLTKYPFLYSTYDLDQARGNIKSLIVEEQIELIHAEPGYVWPGIPQTKIPIVLAEHNIEHTVYQGYAERFRLPFLRPLLQIDIKKMELIEKESWQKAQGVIVVSEQDKQTVQSMVNVLATTVPNGVDSKYFAFKNLQTTREDFQALFVGSFRWMQNVDAVKRLLSEIWPVILERYPKARLTIVGKSFPANLQSKIPNGVQIQPNIDDIRESYYHSDILLAPIEVGGGTKYKILEAMACGLPVITTKKGIEGMKVRDTQHLFLADTPGDYCRIIDSAIINKDKEKFLRAARGLVEAEYSWDSIANELDSVWKQTVA